MRDGSTKEIAVTLKGDAVAAKATVARTKSAEELYNKLKSWTPNSMPSVHNNGTCVVCGTAQLQKRGYERKAKLLYQRLQCQSCGKWQIGERIKE